jgi:hypothetical protein
MYNGSEGALAELLVKIANRATSLPALLMLNVGL